MRPIFNRKLTPLDAPRLRPRPRAFLIWDTQERGRALQIRPSGHGSYKFIYSYDSKSRWITIGPADTVSLAEAREQAIALRLAVHQGQDPASPRAKGNSSTGTFATIAARYVEE